MEVTSIAPADVPTVAADMKKKGYRLVVMTCTPAAEGYDITYSYDKDTKLAHYRITVAEGAEIPSIGASYGGAFVYENEIHDLYGFAFKGMTLDFQGTFIRTSIPYPFKKTMPEPTVTKVPHEKKDGGAA
ncbi:MAG: NADH-quinone oxidoreductase subunit C [Methanocorpusculum sp.]|nr:NADH-quinone oxidoreductase subunit C [Methanocorpusculum sp.]